MTTPPEDLTVRLRDLRERVTPVRSGWNLRVKDNGEERYELIGDPCGFPVATFGDHNDAAFDLACRKHLPALLDRIKQLEAALSSLVSVPAVRQVLGVNHTEGCPCPMCKALAALNKDTNHG